MWGTVPFASSCLYTNTFFCPFYLCLFSSLGNIPWTNIHSCHGMVTLGPIPVTCPLYDPMVVPRLPATCLASSSHLSWLAAAPRGGTRFWGWFGSGALRARLLSGCCTCLQFFFPSPAKHALPLDSDCLPGEAGGGRGPRAIYLPAHPRARFTATCTHAVAPHAPLLRLHCCTS